MTSSPNRVQLSSSLKASSIASLFQMESGSDADAVFQEFAVLRGRSTSPLGHSGSFHGGKNGSPLNRNSASPSSLALKHAPHMVEDFQEPTIPRSLLPQAVARLRLHFSDRELSTEVLLSASKAGLNHDEFLFLVTSNINRRLSIEKVIKAFLELQPSGKMSIDELRILVSSALRLESTIYDGANFEPLTSEEFDLFCGKVDPRGTGFVHIATLLAALFPNVPFEVLEEILLQYGIGSVAEQQEIITDEARRRIPIEEDANLQFRRLLSAAEESHARALALERENADARAFLLDQQRRKAAAERDRRQVEQRAQAEQQETTSRAPIVEAERTERAAIGQAAAKSKKEVAARDAAAARALLPPPPKPKSDAGCCRIVKE
ncbi:Hypothetical protein, putative [Bodo saltans]|uniref:Uncharacterized protein n=1 Tax=Bodo saltans TaxID=75058 RepID=A0A0S4JB07_BODSA|nr:Hypothetical protein, putative [Bodo saltans]|eukprot:CUG86340.1 Hypothetical protein, putative [Bodo saltans]